ncbi:hypothetical protein D3C81_2144410 [compost metagenome]
MGKIILIFSINQDLKGVGCQVPHLFLISPQKIPACIIGVKAVGECLDGLPGIILGIKGDGDKLHIPAEAAILDQQILSL